MKTQYRLVLAGILLLMPAQTLTVYAGSLNGNEQELLGVISGTETYNGQTYRVKAEYIEQARAYFMQDDVDITDEQKQEALQTMYGSIGQGVTDGYLEPVGGSGSVYKGESGSGSAQSGGSVSGGKRGLSDQRNAGRLYEDRPAVFSGDRYTYRHGLFGH